MEAVECGAASLTMVLRHFGHHAELAEVREVAGVSRDGVTAKSIVHAARHYGLVPRARKLEPEALSGVSGPAILHWEMNHFVVFDRWTARGVRILDPGVGPRTRLVRGLRHRASRGSASNFTPGETSSASRRGALRSSATAPCCAAPRRALVCSCSPRCCSTCSASASRSRRRSSSTGSSVFDQRSWLDRGRRGARARSRAAGGVGAARALAARGLRAHLDVTSAPRSYSTCSASRCASSRSARRQI